MVGKVQELILENFKSYEGRVSVEFWRRFTCVVGPNGSGKSNLIDAISFVLCVEAAHLVGDRLRDLVHRKEGEATTDITRAAVVELVYVEQGSDAPSLITTHFRRTIQIDGTVSLHCNGDLMDLPDYTKKLEAIHILSKVRNFLVFQGDVETVARQQGRDLTAFFEQVSGSFAHREEYEQLASDKALKEETMRMLNIKKRNALHERKRMSNQKEEAEAYRDLEKQLHDLQVEYFLFRLFCIERRSEKARGTRDRREGELAETIQKVEAADTQLRAKDAQRAQARLAINKAERAAARLRADLEKLVPETIKNQSELNVKRERLEDLQRAASRDEARCAQLEAQVNTLRQDREKLTLDLQEVEKEKEEHKVLFTPEQLEEFRNAQALAERDTAESSQKVRELEGSIRTVAGEHAQRRVEVREGRARRDQLRTRIQELTESEREISRVSDSRTQEAQDVKTRMETAQTQAGGHAGEKERLLVNRKELIQGIQDITANERQIDRDRTLSQTSAALVKLVPGVHGRVIELCRIPSRQHQTALSVALGGYADAVIVDTFDAGRKCVSYLRDRMLEAMTFLPLDKLRVQPPDQRLWAAANKQNGVVMALKCLKFFDQRYARAFEFLLGDVVVADSLEVGRRFVFEELRKLGLGCRVVTVDCETISRDGNLSVSYDAARVGSRFEFQKIDDSKRQLEEIDRRLQEIHKLEATEGAEANALQHRVRELEGRALESEAALKRIREELAHRQRELKGTESELQVSEPELEHSEKAEADLREQLRTIEESISQAVSQYFARLSAEKGVDDVRLYEREWRRNRGDTQRRQNDISQRLGSVQAELGMMEQALKEQVVGKAREAVAKCQAEIESLEAAHSDFTRRKLDLDNQVAPLLEDCKQQETEEIQCEKEASMLREQLFQAKQDLAKVETLRTEAAVELQTLEDLQQDVLQQSVLQDVNLPRQLGGSNQPAAEVSATSDAANAGDIDFSMLATEDRDVADIGQAAVSLKEEEFQTRIRQLDTQLQKVRPNLKAIDELSQMSKETEDLVNDAKAAKEKLEEVDGRFEKCRGERRRLFMECFQKVAAEIDKIYKRLTANTASLSSASEGGSAYLDLEDTENPFSAGVKFTAIPPAKRFTDIGQLSGGERTLAAIALLFAVHAFKRPPFLVLDEVDAHLDAYNMQAFASYVAACDVQTVVISLKDHMYTRCEGLVGVTKNKKEESSVVFTVDLLRIRQGQLPVLAASPAMPASPASRPPLVAPVVAQPRCPGSAGGDTTSGNTSTVGNTPAGAIAVAAGTTVGGGSGGNTASPDAAAEPMESTEDAVAPTEAEDEDEEEFDVRAAAATSPAPTDREVDLSSGRQSTRQPKSRRLTAREHSGASTQSGQRNLQEIITDAAEEGLGEEGNPMDLD